MASDYLQSVIKRFEYYKMLGEKAFQQADEKKLNWVPNDESNSIATIVKHLSGNMTSRWTDFLNTDGEKEWRNRDLEFENSMISKDELMNLWKKGWACLFETLHALQETDLQKVVTIRKEAHTVTDAINRQLAHYPYHIGQIVFISKMLSDSWVSISIPKGQSESYNAEMTQRQNETKLKS